MIRRRVRVVNKLGLHARAAARFVTTASGFESDIRLGCNGQQVNGKSIMGVMMLAASQGASLDLVADGVDEERAATALERLVAERFGEEE
ncbi:MAG TPA: HPr family phosphocarrier protein [Sedimenticola sp.]|nr:HPr family phosphocarrier protein [Sedimenticola sp.]